MLAELRVRNLALVESATVRFAPGLNVVTGATGAGKSLLLQALTLVLGGRWSREMLRTGADRMQVQAVFEVDADVAARVAELIDEPAPEGPGPHEILVARRVDASGRNRAEIEGTLVPVGTLRELGTLLAEIHGQSEHQALLDPVHQTELLDRAAGLHELREAFADRLLGWREAAGRLTALRTDADARQRRIEELDALAEEVGAVDPEPGESDALRGERELLAAAERHREGLATALALVSDGGPEGDEPALDQLGRAGREVSGTAEHSADVRAAQELLDGAAENVQEAARLLQAALEGLDADPDRLERVQERLEELGALLRRHGPTEEDALRRAEEAAAEAAALRADERDAGGLEERVAALASDALAAGTALDAARREAGDGFSARVRDALAELEMKGTRFEVSVAEREGEASPLLEAATELGLAPIELLASPNAGEELRPLARIASGGELARTALAVKGQLAGADRVPLLAFDEIDADVGPRLGSVIGRRLADLAAAHQVLVITHLPQVAAHAASHLRIRKEEAGGRTFVRVDALESGEREREIAEMIRGPGRADEALDQARAMLAEADEG
jgi:DNA repair protein RecN (Recombination protein N)